jgi:hypothetical protein
MPELADGVPAADTISPRRSDALLAGRFRRLRSPLALPLALVLIPLLAGVVALLVSWVRGSPYFPFGDQTFIELHVRDLGRHAVLTGPFSRYDWDHPGPLIYYALAPLYWLTGASPQSLAITPLLTNAACVVAITALVRRRAGNAAAIWTLVVLAIYLRVFGAGSLRNNWNPDFPVLPCALMVFLSWALACGSRWTLPAIAALASFQVQSHAGYAPAVAACIGAAAGVLVVRAVLARARPAAGAEPGRLRPWALPLVVTFGTLVVLWLPPILDAATHSGGNLRALFDYFGSAKPDGTWRAGFSWLNSDLGALPAYLTGVDRRAAPSVQPPLPGWTGIVALLALAASIVLAVRRRSRDTAVLVVLTAAMTLAGLVSVRRIVGPLFDYLAAWVLVAGILLWTTLGVALLGNDGKRLPLRVPQRMRRPAWAAACVALAALAGVGAADQAGVTTPWTYTDTVVRSLDTQTVSWLDTVDGRHDLVRMQSTGAGDLPSFIDANNRMSGLFLALYRSGVRVRVAPYYVHAYGKPRGKDADQARWVLTVAPASATGQRGDLVARAGDWLVYATPGRSG